MRGASDRDGTPFGACVIHPALVRPHLYLGVERPVLALEGTLALALLAGVGPHVATLALVAVIVLLLHPVMVWVTARDPQATEVYLRAQGYADYYAPHAGVQAPIPRPRPSIPAVR